MRKSRPDILPQNGLQRSEHFDRWIIHVGHQPIPIDIHNTIRRRIQDL